MRTNQRKNIFFDDVLTEILIIIPIIYYLLILCETISSIINKKSVSLWAWLFTGVGLATGVAFLVYIILYTHRRIDKGFNEDEKDKHFLFLFYLCFQITVLTFLAYFLLKFKKDQIGVFLTIFLSLITLVWSINRYFEDKKEKNEISIILVPARNIYLKSCVKYNTENFKIRVTSQTKQTISFLGIIKAGDSILDNVRKQVPGWQKMIYDPIEQKSIDRIKDWTAKYEVISASEAFITKPIDIGKLNEYYGFSGKQTDEYYVLFIDNRNTLYYNSIFIDNEKIEN